LTSFDEAAYFGVCVDENEADPTDYSVYEWSKFLGEKGDPGDSVYIKSTSVTYAQSSSGTTIPSSWQTSIPSVSDGNYLWTRTIVSYSDGTSTTSYSVARMGENGSAGQSVFKSLVFVRQESTPSTPSGGSYSSPVPSGWNDGIPDGIAQVWMSSRVFTSDGKSPQTSSWSTPQKLSDSADFDVEYSSVESPGNPTDNPSNWSNDADSTTIWMATRVYSGGAWGDWEISQIKGEDGRGVIDTIIYYATTTDDTAPTVPVASTDPSSPWVKSTTPIAPDATNK
jgi:hypothetical protein